VGKYFYNNYNNNILVCNVMSILKLNEPLN
jgi:hypothetical protein